MSVIPSAVGIRKEKTSPKVIGSPGYIQDLIDNASDGDTIYIPSGTYYENITIDKSISLVGEDKDTTIIDSNWSEYVIYVSADNVNISGFTIRKGWYGIDIHTNYNTITGNNIRWNYEGGIRINYSSGNTISKNNITNNMDGIGLYYSSNNTITNNNISLNSEWIAGCGILLSKSDNNTIKENNVMFNRNGLLIYDSSNNTISRNNITKNGYEDNWGGSGIYFYSSDSNTLNGNNITSNIYVGLSLLESSNNTMKNNILQYNSLGILLRGVAEINIISDNTILNNLGGIALFSASHNMIRHNNIMKNDEGIHIDWLKNEFMYPAILNVIIKNNFINNKLSASFEFGLLNSWFRNYWDRPRLLPKPIFGSVVDIPWINFDLRPALKPYDI